MSILPNISLATIFSWFILWLGYKYAKKLSQKDSPEKIQATQFPTKNFMIYAIIGYILLTIISFVYFSPLQTCIDEAEEELGILNIKFEKNKNELNAKIIELKQKVALEEYLPTNNDFLTLKAMHTQAIEDLTEILNTISYYRNSCEIYETELSELNKVMTASKLSSEAEVILYDFAIWNNNIETEIIEGELISYFDISEVNENLNNLNLAKTKLQEARIESSSGNIIQYEQNELLKNIEEELQTVNENIKLLNGIKSDLENEVS